MFVFFNSDKLSKLASFFNVFALIIRNLRK